MRMYFGLFFLLAALVSCDKTSELEQASIYGGWYLSTQDLIRIQDGNRTVTTDTVNDKTIFYDFKENGKFDFQGGTGEYYLSNDSLYCKYAATSSSRFYGFKISVSRDELIMRVTDTYPNINTTTEQVNKFRRL
ncbi:hypothetical protein ACFSQ3_02285 [Sphingobacterium corticis]|uniref:Lipocalin-like domain-containing protein n=1 Tax=Sphingobacterium corticis TaxID=1812823 RepID=A0ABW5NH85_9SPHI